MGGRSGGRLRCRQLAVLAAFTVGAFVGGGGAARATVAGSFTNATDTTLVPSQGSGATAFDNTFEFGITESPLRLGRPNLSTSDGVGYLGVRESGLSIISGDDCIPYNFSLRWYSDSDYSNLVGSQNVVNAMGQYFGPIVGSTYEATYWMRFDSFNWQAAYYYQLYGNCGDNSRRAGFSVSSHPPGDWSQATAWNVMATTLDEALHPIVVSPLVFFQDHFNRDPSASLGAAWQLLSGTMLQLQNSEAEEVSPQQVEDAVVLASYDVAEQTVDVDWAPTPAADDAGVDGRILARVQDAGDYYGGRLAHGATTDQVILYKVVAGISTQLAITEVPRIATYPYHLQFVASGSSLLFRVSRLGQSDLVVTATDSDVASGSAGLLAFAGWGGTLGRSSFDNFLLSSVPAAPGSVDAGEDQVVAVQTAVTLLGAIEPSSCNPITLQWSFSGKPAGSMAALGGATTVAPTFTPDLAGEYTLTLVATCGSAVSSGTVTVHALACQGNELFASVRDARVPAGGSLEVSVNLMGATYSWSLPQNDSGASLSPEPATGPNITYQAGNAAGQDLLHVSSSVCGTVDIPITVYSAQPPEATVTATPNPTRGAAQVAVDAVFFAPTDAAQLCVDGASCVAMTPQSSVEYTSSLATGPLAAGSHRLTVQGMIAGGGWGGSSFVDLAVNRRTPILLLNGYNLTACGDHPQQWFFAAGDADTSIPCQIAQDFGASPDCPSQPSDCQPSYDVCVVTGVDGKAGVVTAAGQLAAYLAAHPFLTAGGPPILVGHSYGGQISRFYAATHPGQVTAIVTLDTPHTGTPRARLAAVLEGAASSFLGVPDRCIDQCCDDALQYFLQDEQAIPLFDQLSALETASPTPIYALASEVVPSAQDVNALVPIPGIGGLVAASLDLYNQGDNVVPVDNQLGHGAGSCLQAAGSSLTCPDLVTTLPYFHLARSPYVETTARVPFDVLHNDILEQPASWRGFYCAALAPALNAILGMHAAPSICATLGSPFAGQGGGPARRASTGSHAAETAQAAVPLPPPLALQTVLETAGQFNAGAPQASVQFAVESGAAELQVQVGAANANPNLTLTSPSGTVLSAVSVDGLATFYSATGGGVAAANAQSLLVRRPEAGQWMLGLSVPAGAGGPDLPAAGASWTASVSVRAALSLSLSLADSEFLTGEIVGVKATLGAPGAPVTWASVSATVVGPSGVALNGLALFDDGQHGDGAAGDGVYGGSFTAGAAGAYSISVLAAGSSPLGSLQRQADAELSVGTAGATVSGPFAEAAPDADGDGHRDSLGWSFTANLPAAGTYTFTGNLLAADGSTVSQAVATVAVAGAGSVPVALTFAGVDIYRKAEVGPYTLANLRIAMATATGERLAGRPADRVVSGGPYWSWMSFQRDPVPSFTWGSPVSDQIVTTNSVTLQWTVFDGNGATTLDLYYDTTGTGFAGTPIVTGIPATQGAMSYVWDLSGLPDGIYYVYARVRNGDFSQALYGGDVHKLLDTDGDGMPDAWEIAHGLDPNDPADALLDPDRDGLANVDEYAAGTDPHRADSDGGGESDLSEAVNGRDPTNPADDVTGLTLRNVAPGAGDSGGGEQVLIQGSGLQPGATVSFDDQPAAKVVFVNSTRLVVTTPAHADGAAAVSVANPAGGGTASLAAGFLFLCGFNAPVTASNGGSFCPGQTIQLAAAGAPGASFQWTGPNGFTSTLASPAIPDATAAAAGVYTVTATVGGCRSQASTSIVSTAPAAPVASNNGPLCSGQDLQLSASNVPGATYSWTGPGGFVSTQQNPVISAAGQANAGTYAVTATAAGCASAAGTTAVQIGLQPAAPTAANDGPACAGQDVHLSASGAAGASFLWSGPGGFTSAAQDPVLAAAQPAASGTYSVTATLGGCVSPSASTAVAVRPLPTAAVSGSAVACPGAGDAIEATLTGTPPWTLGWSDGFEQTAVAASPAQRLVAPEGTTTYTVASVSDAFCAGTASGSAVITIDGGCSQLYTLPPCRVVDTRGALGPLGGPALEPSTVREFALVGTCGVPATAKAVSINVTITQAEALGDLRIFPSDLTQLPQVSTLNWAAGATRANNAVVKLPADGTGSIGVRLDSAGPVHFILDVNGYFQ